MPSPAAHSLIGLANGVARFVPRVPGWRALARRLWENRVPLFICILLANAPDIDYLFGIPGGDLNRYHHAVTHTAAWTIALALAVRAVGWPDRSWRSFLFVLALPASHLVADFLTADFSKPYGMMLAWPLYVRYWLSPVPVFASASKSSFCDLVSWRNLLVVTRELLILLPVVALVAALKLRPHRRQEAGPPQSPRFN